jgi:hypothetical protein
MIVKRYDKGGEVKQLLKALESQSLRSPMDKLPVSSNLGGLQTSMPVMNQAATAESTSTSPKINPYFKESIESAAFSKRILDKNEEIKQIKKLGFDPMASGSAESVSPMKFVSPVGDVEDMYQGVKMAYEGIKEGEAGKAALGGGLALGAAGMAFLPGNLSMVRSYAQSVNNPMLDNIFKSIGDGKEFEEVISDAARNFSKSERLATAQDVDDLLDLSWDEYSGLDLSNTEKVILEEIRDISRQEKMSTKLDLSPSPIEKKASVLPDDIEGFEKKVQLDGPNSREVSYTDMDGNYIEINSGPVSEKAPELVKEYGDRNVHTMNMDFSTAKETSENSIKQQRTQYNVMSTLLNTIERGDLVGIPALGTLSTDSYPLLLRNLKKGKRYQSASEESKRAIKERGAKLIDKVGADDAVSYRELNSMGKFSNYFGIPNADLKQVQVDGMLTETGSYKARDSFNSIEEANDYLKQIKEDYIDPKLEEVGLPPAKIVSFDDARFPERAGYTKIQFPYPVVEKLLNGGRIKPVKKRKKGMQTKKR